MGVSRLTLLAESTGVFVDNSSMKVAVRRVESAFNWLTRRLLAQAPFLYAP